MQLNPKKRSAKKDIIFLFIILVFSLLATEGMSRTVVAWNHDLSFWHSPEEALYPMLHNQFVNYSPNDTNVLLLGGSTLFYVGARIPLENFGNTHFYNLAFSGHSSLDSLHKYDYLLSHGYHFDYVVFYHGINEVRFNNIPKTLYLDNYDHIPFYRLANSVFDYNNPFLSILLQSSLGYRLYTFYISVVHKDESIPKGSIKREWIPFGQDIKTQLAFERNLRRVMQLATSQNGTVITPKFAFHVPQNYSKESFANLSLGYQRTHNGGKDQSLCCYIELWGDPSHVIRGIESHNEILLKLQDKNNYLDTSVISVDIKNFYDICHFSRKGEKEFIDLVFDRFKENG